MDEKLGGDVVGDLVGGVGVEPVTIDAQVNGFLNYASWQNSVPLLQSLTLHNPTKHVLNGLRLTAESSP